MMMAENALLRDFSLSCPASLFGAEPMESAKKAVKSCMTLSSFPCAQMLKTNTRYVHDFAKRTLTVTVNARYMSTGKEVNDLRCVAADIAESIKRSLLESTDFFQVIAAYQSWLKRFFVYKRPVLRATTPAVGLLQTRQGVCQAIAALSMVILPHLGILARYGLRRRLLRHRLGPACVERGMGAERRMAPGRFHIRPAPQNDAEHVYVAR